MHVPARSFGITAGACALLFVLARAHGAPQPAFPGEARQIADGVSLYHVTDPALLEPAAPVSVWLLRVDPRSADLRAVLANDEIVDTETVPQIAQRYGAAAAVNAGFFLLPSGDPSGLYKLNGQDRKSVVEGKTGVRGG